MGRRAAAAAGPESPPGVAAAGELGEVELAVHCVAAMASVRAQLAAPLALEDARRGGRESAQHRHIGLAEARVAAEVAPTHLHARATLPVHAVSGRQPSQRLSWRSRTARRPSTLTILLRRARGLNPHLRHADGRDDEAAAAGAGAPPSWAWSSSSDARKRRTTVGWDVPTRAATSRTSSSRTPQLEHLRVELCPHDTIARLRDLTPARDHQHTDVLARPAAVVRILAQMRERVDEPLARLDRGITTGESRNAISRPCTPLAPRLRVSARSRIAQARGISPSAPPRRRRSRTSSTWTIAASRASRSSPASISRYVHALRRCACLTTWRSRAALGERGGNETPKIVT